MQNGEVRGRCALSSTSDGAGRPDVGVTVIAACSVSRRPADPFIVCLQPAEDRERVFAGTASLPLTRWAEGHVESGNVLFLGWGGLAQEAERMFALSRLGTPRPPALLGF